MDEVFCNQCGHANPDRGNFCSSYGAVLDVRGDYHTITLSPIDGQAGPPSEEVSVTLDEVPEGSGMLVIKRGPGAGSKFVLEQPVVSAGRHPDSDIFLDDVTVSRRHAEVLRRPDGYVLRDAGSLNGTYLNRERIEEEATISNGDEVQIGRCELGFRAGMGWLEPG
ncbi:hypothetical protein BH20ACT1_BH20ACT1_13970 [soil metagenome]